MFPVQTRMSLLEAGRASLEMWVRAGHMTEPGLAADAQAIYDRMASRAPWPAQQANRAHLVFMVLPMAALYTALRGRGKAEHDAVEEVQAAVKAVAGPLRVAVGLLLRTGRGRRLFMRTLAPGPVGRFFPAPAWQTTWTERSQNRVAFDVTRCYDLDMLRLLDAAPVAVALCTGDAYVIPWSRTGTLATGANRCDFCFELLPASTSQQAAAAS
ncbi:MAG: L-2-amino-thiazoline-4-carboxylic acid hydrolase [Micromonosporaceae bacterium]